MLHLIYDTETTGLPIDYKAHVHDVDNWPRLVQLAWAVVDDDFKTLTSRNYIINPHGLFDIPVEASSIHGITDERANDEGIDIILPLVEFQLAQELCNVQVGHNVNFDRKVIGAEFIRADMEEAYERGKSMDRVCTMFKTIKFCGLKNKNGGPKFPTLQELHTRIFGEGFEGAHDAMVDINATIRCYSELKSGGILGGWL
jgi:DNA polymerase III epsilon subunit-like protein